MTKYTINFADGTSASYNGHTIGPVRRARPNGWFRIMRYEVSKKTGKAVGQCHEVVRFNGHNVNSIESVELNMQSDAE